MNCVEGKCRTIRCLTKGDCGALFECSKGHCRPQKCFTDVECGVFAKCFQGKCFPKRPGGLPLELCSQHNDCGYGKDYSGKKVKWICLKASSI